MGVPPCPAVDLQRPPPSECRLGGACGTRRARRPVLARCWPPRRHRRPRIVRRCRPRPPARGRVRAGQVSERDGASEHGIELQQGGGEGGGEAGEWQRGAGKGRPAAKSGRGLGLSPRESSPDAENRRAGVQVAATAGWGWTTNSPGVATCGGFGVILSERELCVPFCFVGGVPYGWGGGGMVCRPGFSAGSRAAARATADLRGSCPDRSGGRKRARRLARAGASGGRARCSGRHAAAWASDGKRASADLARGLLLLEKPCHHAVFGAKSRREKSF